MFMPCISFVGVLLCFFGIGNALKCYSYQCTNYSNPIIPNKPCTQPKAVTCGVSEDRCLTQRNKVKANMSGQAVVMYQETRNCTSSLQCHPTAVCKVIGYMLAKTGQKLEKCELGCCTTDLCNTNGIIPTPGPQPTGPSGSDLSCYSCSNLPIPIPGFPVAKTDCKNPIKQTCGPDIVPGMQQDRCLRIKVKGAGFAGEIRNCSGFSFCNPDAFCKAANQTGGVSSCDVSCCYGNLCNTDVVPASGGALTGTLTCLLVMFARGLEMLAEKIFFEV